MFVSCTLFVLSGRGLCDRPISRPEESYRLWCVCECDQVQIKTLYNYCEQVGIRGKDYERTESSTQIVNRVAMCTRTSRIIESSEVRV
jgi:hypothetical protein